MTKSRLTKICFILFTVFLPFITKAQLPPSLKNGLVSYLTPDSVSYIKMNMVAQTWFRYNQNNPGSIESGTGKGQLQNNTADIGIRRIRLLLSGQLTPRTFFFVQFGQNSWNQNSARKAASFFHDVTGEYAFVKRKLTIGGGLNGWDGPGRFANSSVGSILGLDPPLFQETTNDINDQFVRNLGIYAKGKLGKFDYRVALSHPLLLSQASTVPPPLGVASSYSYKPPKPSIQGYFMYQFFDQESNLLPSTVGTYLGKKKILNIGAGFKYQNKAMWSEAKGTTDTTYHAMSLFAVDIFYDAPLSEKGNALTLYGGYFHYDYGKGYLRLENPMNTTTGVLASQATLNGTGNGYPGIGTGSVGYGQAAYKFRNNMLGEYGTLQLYFEAQYASYDALNSPMVLEDMGINWLIAGHNSKFTLNYQNRPIFSSTTEKVISHKGGLVLQYQVSF
jgi:hypothetical protein